MIRADAATRHNPAQAEELKAVWELTDFHMQKATVRAARFKRKGIAARVGMPLLYWAWTEYNHF